MSGYAKIYSKIVDSSLNALDVETRWFWVILLAKANAAGFVEANPSMLFRAANLTQEAAQKALQELSSPDPLSSTTEHEGRRIEVHSDGVQILNHEKYRNRRGDPNSRDAVKQRAYRERGKVTPVTTGNVTDKKERNATPVSVSVSASVSEKKKRKKAKVDLPDNWQPNPKHAQVADQENVDLVRAEEEFRDWAEKTGAQYVNWDAGFRSWLRSPHRKKRQATGAPGNIFAELARKETERT